MNIELNDILRLLSSLHPDIDFKNRTGLIKDHILTSLDIVSIVTALYNEYDIEVSVEDIIPENFDSAAAVKALADKLAEQ